MTALVSGALGALGCGLLIVAVWRRWSWLVGWGLLALGQTYGVWLLNRGGGGLGLAAPPVAAGLLGLGEAAFYGAGRSSGTETGGRQLAWIASVSLAAMVVSGLVLLAATISAERSLLLTVAGTLAAAVAITLPSVRFARSTRPAEPGTPPPRE